jgi:hypothetical protein
MPHEGLADRILRGFLHTTSPALSTGFTPFHLQDLPDTQPTFFALYCYLSQQELRTCDAPHPLMQYAWLCSYHFGTSWSGRENIITVIVDNTVRTQG